MNAKNVFSDENTPLDAAFVFYLGVFEGGFNPSSSNISEWAENWTTIDAVNYNPEYQIFNARHTTTEADPAPGTKGYIWGIRRDSSLSEWVLISDSSWTWPENNLLGLKKSWMVGEASEAIIGSINSGEHQIVTVNVGNAPLPSIDYAIWAKRFFVDGDPNADASADPDGNGRVNAIDYALDDNPVKSGDSGHMDSGVFEIIDAGSETDPDAEGHRYLAVLIRPSIDADVTFSGTVATDPGFTQNAESAVVEDLGDGTLLIRDSEPVDTLTQSKFIKVNIN